MADPVEPGPQTVSFDWKGCNIAPLYKWQDYADPVITTDTRLPSAEQCLANGVGQANLGFAIEGLGGQAVSIHAGLNISIPMPPTPDWDAAGELYVGLVTDDWQKGFIIHFGAYAQVSIYRVVAGELEQYGVFGQLSGMLVEDWSIGEIIILFSFQSDPIVHIEGINADGESTIILNDTILGDALEGVNRLLMSPDVNGLDVNVRGLSSAVVWADRATPEISAEAKLKVISGESNVTFSVGKSDETGGVVAQVASTNPLRIAFPHDIIFTSGSELAPYSGYFWPPSTPIPPSQIYIPRGPDPITGDPNFKRTQWTITTTDTPREIQMGETPGFAYGDPDTPGSPPANC